MAYNQEKDRLIKLFENLDEKGNGLLYSIMSYNNGEKKLQMSRTYCKTNGTMGYGNTGRLSVNELKRFNEILPEIIRIMEE